MTTTTKLRTPTRTRWIELSPPVAATICIFALLLIGLIVGRLQQTPTTATAPTPALSIIVIATSPAVIVPTTVPAPVQVAAVLPRFVVCYDQPVNGSVLGPIPAPDASAIVARYGAAWVMTPWNGGYCWLRSADVGLLDVTDLQPTQAPIVVYVASQNAQEAAGATQVIEAVPTMAPSQLAAVEQPAPQQLVILDREQWAVQAQKAAHP